MVSVGDLQLDPGALTASLAGVPLDLTGYEFAILMALADRAGQVLSRERLMELARGNAEEAFDRSIDVHNSRLRQKLGTTRAARSEYGPCAAPVTSIWPRAGHDRAATRRLFWKIYLNGLLLIVMVVIAVTATTLLVQPESRYHGRPRILHKVLAAELAWQVDRPKELQATLDRLTAALGRRGAVYRRDGHAAGVIWSHQATGLGPGRPG